MRNMSVGFYNSEPRKFNRDFRRGKPRMYQSSRSPSSPQPHQKSDFFLEAGRLAVEYLVSQGLLPSNVLPGKSHGHHNSQDREISKSPNRVSSGRRSPNNHDKISSRSYSWERRNYGDSRSYSPDLGRENGRAGSLPEKTNSLLAVEVNYDKNHKDSSKKENSDSKVACSSSPKDDEELLKPVDEAKEETKDDTCNHDQAEMIHGNKSPIHQSENNIDISSKEEKNATEVHCFLSDKSLKNEPLFITEEMDMSGTGNGSHDSIKDDNVKDPSKCGVDQLKSVDFLSFTDQGFSPEEESSFAKNDRNKKRALEEESMTEVAKKARPWLSVAQSNEDLNFSDLSEEKPVFSGKRVISICNQPTDYESFHAESAVDRIEEKQLFSSGYKICDLNLMEGSDMHENHGVAALMYPSLSAPKKEAQIDIDLSMSKNFGYSNEYGDSQSVSKDVQIIESSSVKEGKTLKFPTKTAEDGMENFAENPQDTNDNPDGQDGYGLMISELLGNDVPNCSTVQPDINCLQDDISLHHGEGIFTEDDPIYMSLEGIPLTGLLHGWEQPSQEKNPFDL